MPNSPIPPISGEKVRFWAKIALFGHRHVHIVWCITYICPERDTPNGAMMPLGAEALALAWCEPCSCREWVMSCESPTMKADFGEGANGQMNRRQ